MKLFNFNQENTPSKEYTCINHLLQLQSDKIDDYVDTFKRFLHSEELKELTNTTLEKIKKSSSFRGIALDFSSSDWRIFRNKYISFGLKTLPNSNRLDKPSKIRNQGFLSPYPNDLLIGINGRGSVTIEYFESSVAENFDYFDKSARLKKVNETSLKHGSVIELKAGKNCINILENKNVVILELATLQHHSIVWNYDPNTLKASHALSADISASRLNFAMEIFQKFNYTKAASNLYEISQKHSSHFVRWEALKKLLTLDLNRGIMALKQSVKDPHEHVRNAAQKTIDNLRLLKII